MIALKLMGITMYTGRVARCLDERVEYVDTPSHNVYVFGLDTDSVYAHLNDMLRELGYSLERVEDKIERRYRAAARLDNGLYMFIDDPTVVPDSVTPSWPATAQLIPGFLLDLQEYVRVNRS